MGESPPGHTSQVTLILKQNPEMKHILNTSRDPEPGALVLGQNQGVRRDGVAAEC